MTPYDFVNIARKESVSNSTILIKDIKIFSSPTQEWEILSYYYCSEEQCFILDIAKEENTE